MRIVITHKHIRNGVKADPANHPLKKAVDDILRLGVYVRVKQASLFLYKEEPTEKTQPWRVIPLARSIVNWVKNFDLGFNHSPRTVWISLPKEVLK
jgi:hypothetical protein